MIWNPFRANRLLKIAIAAIEQANETARRALDNTKKFEELCDRQAERIGERDFKIACLMADCDPINLNRHSDCFGPKPERRVN
jgi:PleD family two-component response regulator